MRTLTAAIVVATMSLIGCSPDRTPKGPDVPEGTPNCEEACNTAWPCGGVLENDLQGCLDRCDDQDENDADFRVCVFETECELMGDCKVYSPTGAPPAEE